MSEDTERIKERLDLADLVGEYVQLKRNGQHYKGLCPFHSEKTPSFIVSPDKGIWHCFGCSEGGDAFSFVQRVEGTDFPAVLQMLAERTGVELSKRSQGSGGSDPRTRLFEVMDLAARFYQEVLINQAAGKQAKAYLRERGVKPKTMELFELGYAPQRWDTLQTFLSSKGYTMEEMMQAGLVGRNDGGKAYDRFRGRIMWPVYDVQGRCVAFGGRILPAHATGNEGKYINSPETSIYRKRQVVYNLQRAKKNLRRHQPCLVVEGYMDVIMLVQVGVENVVASSGTAFTPEHVVQLKRYTDVLHFAFDADAAGVQAAQSATQEALSAGMRVACVLFPRGEDPADVAGKGKRELNKYLDKPTSLAELLLQRLKESDEAADRTTMLQDILPFVQQVASPVQQGEMVQEIAATLHVPESTIVEQLQKVPAPRADKAAEVESGQDDTAPAIAADLLLLGTLIADPAARAKVWPALDSTFVLDEGARSLYTQLQHLAEARGDFFTLSAHDLLSAVDEELVAQAEGVRRVAEEHLSHTSTTAEEEATLLVQLLQVRALEARLKSLQEELSEKEGAARTQTLKDFQKTAEQLVAVRAR